MDEFLRLSAPLAAQEASRLCARQGLGCGWYHGVWQYLSLLGIVTTPRDHAEFFVDAIAKEATDRPRRVLVCGAADYGLLHAVLGAFGGIRDVPWITVLDLCETALMLNRWYAERARVEISTVRSDILDYQPPGPFDVACTHCFLGYFAPSERHRLWRKWAEILAPGGRVITINRIRSDSSDSPVGFPPALAGAFRERVLQAAERRQADLDIEPRHLADLAAEYAQRKRTYPVGSLEELAEPIARSGFTIERLGELPALSPAPGETSPGPTVRTSRNQYVGLIATRRA
jgi:SAM-dependent methyltransferase